MRHIPVSSSNLASVGYDAKQQILEIRFQNGRLYRYSGVPAAVHQALMDAPSHGTYFNAYIRYGYPYIQIR